MSPHLLDSQFAVLEPPAPEEHPIVVGILESPEAVAGRIVGALHPGGTPPTRETEPWPQA